MPKRSRVDLPENLNKRLKAVRHKVRVRHWNSERGDDAAMIEARLSNLLVIGAYMVAHHLEHGHDVMQYIPADDNRVGDAEQRS